MVNQRKGGRDNSSWLSADHTQINLKPLKTEQALESDLDKNLCGNNPRHKIQSQGESWTKRAQTLEEKCLIWGP